MTYSTESPTGHGQLTRDGWDELQSAALSFAARGWPVLPGTYWPPGGTRWIGRHGATALAPVIDLAEASADPVLAAAWWACQPYSVLLATGRGVDVIEVAASASGPLLEPDAMRRLRLAGLAGPFAVAPSGAVLLFVRSTGDDGRPAEPHPALRRHRAGSWVALPPTTHDGAGHRWRVSPAEMGWRLPDPVAGQAALAVLLG